MHFAHVAEINAITNTPGIITTAVLGSEVGRKVSSLGVGTSPWSRVLTS
jgi:hypothetical protein